MIKFRKGKLSNQQRVNIIEAYTNEVYTMRELSKQNNVKTQSVAKLLKKAGVDIKKHSINIRNKRKIYISKECLEFLYKDYGSTMISRVTGISNRVILSRLREYGVSIKGTPKKLPEYWKRALRKPKSKVLKGEDSPSWKAGIHTREKVKCQCGCGQLLSKYDKKGRQRYYITGHCSAGYFKSENVRGEKGCKWKGGITPIMNTLRKSPEYIQWRLIVYKKDNYTCQMCGQKHIDIVAHHIKSFAEFKELRFEPSNGKVLCRSCHLKVHRGTNKQTIKK